MLSESRISEKSESEACTFPTMVELLLLLMLSDFSYLLKSLALSSGILLCFALCLCSARDHTVNEMALQVLCAHLKLSTSVVVTPQLHLQSTSTKGATFTSMFTSTPGMRPEPQGGLELCCIL